MKRSWQSLGTVIFWLSWPALYFYLNSTRRSRLIIHSSGRVLVTKDWLGRGRWTLPGGGKKGNESPIQTALRELKEETGLNLSSKDLKSLISNQPILDTGFKFHIDCFVCELDASIPTSAGTKMEITDIAWLPIKELVSGRTLAPASKDLIETWLASEHLLD